MDQLEINKTLEKTDENAFFARVNHIMGMVLALKLDINISETGAANYDQIASTLAFLWDELRPKASIETRKEIDTMAEELERCGASVKFRKGYDQTVMYFTPTFVKKKAMIQKLDWRLRDLLEELQILPQNTKKKSRIT